MVRPLMAVPYSLPASCWMRMARSVSFRLVSISTSTFTAMKKMPMKVSITLYWSSKNRKNTATKASSTAVAALPDSTPATLSFMSMRPATSAA